MKKWLALISLVSCSFSLPGWVRVKVDARASVEFPTTPEKQNMQGNTMLIADVDTGMRVMVMPLDMLSFGLDSVVLAAQYETDEFMNQLKTGMLDKIPGCSLINEKRVNTNGWPAYEFAIQKEKPDSTFPFKKIFTRTIFVGSILYTLYSFEKEGVDGALNRERFFGSFYAK